MRNTENSWEENMEYNRQLDKDSHTIYTLETNWESEIEE